MTKVKDGSTTLWSHKFMTRYLYISPNGKKNIYICINNMCSKYLENHYYFLSYLLYINCKALAKR